MALFEGDPGVRGLSARRTPSPRILPLLGVLALLAGCSSKEVVGPDGQLPPPLPEGVTVEGNLVRWQTDVASLGCVRYGFAADNLDHMAYPVAAGRRDRAPVLEHEVPLLDLEPGRHTYIQAVNEAPGRPPGYSGIGAFEPAAGPAPALLSSTMIHIGFGDSHLITMPNGKRVLVDGGEREALSAVEEYFRQHGVRALDAALATHVHIDHIGGLVGSFGTTSDGILASLAPAVFFDSPAKSWLRDAYAEALGTAAGARVRRAVLARGQTSADTPDLNWDERVRVTVLSSGRLPGYTPAQSRDNTDINNDSIVLKFSYGDVDFIIGGDAEAAAEVSMLAAFPPAALEVEYYKVHHHGLRDASTSPWLATLNPRVAFIPNTQLTWRGSLAEALAEATSRLLSVGAHIYVIDEAQSLSRTRAAGKQYNVTFATDGVSYEVRLETARQAVPAKPESASGCLAHDADLRDLVATQP